MPRKPTSIDTALRAAIRKAGVTHYALAKLAEVAPAQIDRFMSGERDLRLGTAAKIAAALGLELAAVS
jgi:plasmid maintenance system antidote protein VapI